jgi:ectoine hydroxylase-related dioxygenase (phytanoyl-CoA dioxygenase family)
MGNRLNVNAMNIEQLGFYKFSFTSADIISEAKLLYKRFYGEKKTIGMQVTHNTGSEKMNIEVSRLIGQLLYNDIERHFPSFRFFIGHFIVKQARNGSDFQLHQDWSIVDESKYKSLQLWIPLELSYPENGGMCFLPRSNTFHTNHRSGSFGIPRIPIIESLHPYLSYVRLCPGEAVAFENRLFHGSFSNASGDERLTLLLNLVSKDATTQYYHFNTEKSCCEVYEVNDEILLTHLPKLEKGELPFLTNPVSSKPATQKNNTEITADDLINWVIDDRKKIGCKQHYEFKQFNIIKDEELEKRINHDGFAVIDLLDAEAIKALSPLFEFHFKNRSDYSGRYSSMDSLDGEQRLSIHNKIVEAISSSIDKYFSNWKIPISIIYSKRADGVDDTDWHQDPSFMLNQHLEPIYAIWCPLVDVDKSGGVLGIIPGSHKVMHELRNPLRKWLLASNRRELDKCAYYFNLKAGEAIIYDSRTIHSSSPNLSSIERDCIVLRITHKKAEFFSMEFCDESTTEIWTQEESFFFSQKAREHDLISNTGCKIGKMALFEPLLSSAGVLGKLNEHVLYEHF